MNGIVRIVTIEQLLDYWPQVGVEELLEIALIALKHGLVLVFIAASEPRGLGVAIREGGKVVIIALPSDDNRGFGKAGLAYITNWAKEKGATELEITTSRFSGSSFRYMEKTLGFRRSAITFSKKI